MAKEKQQFKVIIEQDEDGLFVASVPSLPGCHTQAKTIKELKKESRRQSLYVLKLLKPILNTSDDWNFLPMNRNF